MSRKEVELKIIDHLEAIRDICIKYGMKLEDKFYINAFIRSDHISVNNSYWDCHSNTPINKFVFYDPNGERMQD